MNYNRRPAGGADPDTRALLFFETLRDKSYDPASVKEFLRGLRELSADIPILKNISALIGGKAAEGIISSRLESRYLRIRCVQEELTKLDFNQIKPGMVFEDFIFSRIDFSIYNKIEEQTFGLLYDRGLDDYEEAFFEKNFKRGRAEIRDIIHRSYKKIGPLYYNIRGQNPLLLSIMRTLRISLDFCPLLNREEVLNECTGLIRFLLEKPGPQGSLHPALGKESFFYLAQSFGTLFRYIAASLDQLTFTHRDGMETRLFTAVEETPPAAQPGTPRTVLRGTFHPLNKPYTITLVPLDG
ncbi:MAG: hypothetical protein LBP42_02490 [Treponema sp.]|jgi:hypothetical protein|nr:hypothetical protein [Treponema sp.]